MTLGPDTILFNAAIYTVDNHRPWASAIAVRDGGIVAVGDDKAVLGLADGRTVHIDMGGRLVLPGLCDAHIHFYSWSLAQTEVNLAACRSRTEMLHAIRLGVADLAPDAWVIGRGWNESWWGDTDFPTADDIDAVTGVDQPAIFWRSDMHAAVVNTRALALAKIGPETSNPIGGVIERDPHGKATGILKELAIGLVADLIALPDKALELRAVRAGMALLHRIGVTAVHDQRMKGSKDGSRALSTYQALNADGDLSLRVNCNVAAHHLDELEALGLSYGFGDDRLRLGHVKVFADGSLGSRTALLTSPFLKASREEPDNLGVRLTDPAEMLKTFQRAARLGFPISVHAIGDRANQEVLDMIEETKPTTPELRVPHRIEHVQILRTADIERIAALGITASVQPVHVIDDMDLADHLLGDRGAMMYNFRSLADAGVLLAFGSDAPVADPNPFLGIHSALYRQRPHRMHQGSWYGEETVSLAQAIYAYTLGSARAAGWHYSIGSIEPGKRADVIALDRDIFAIAASPVKGDEIAGTQVEFTMFDGRVMHSQL